jgi:HSP20 family molecular chaperone IbpA
MLLHNFSLNNFDEYLDELIEYYKEKQESSSILYNVIRKNSAQTVVEFLLPGVQESNISLEEYDDYFTVTVSSEDSDDVNYIAKGFSTIDEGSVNFPLTNIEIYKQEIDNAKLQNGILYVTINNIKIEPKVKKRTIEIM